MSREVNVEYIQTHVCLSLLHTEVGVLRAGMRLKRLWATRIKLWSSRRMTPGFMPTIKVKKRAGEGETVRESESQREREREIAGGGREGGAREREREGEGNKS